jgi:uncharacterized protein with ATP-grasp and redox domains
MKMTSECFPCFFKLANRLMTHIKLPENKKITIMKDISKFLSEIKKYNNSPAYYSTFMYNIIYKKAKIKDPYKKLKQDYNSKVLKIYPILQKIVKNSSDPIYTSLKLSAIGNTIDYGVETSLDFSLHIKEIENLKFIKDDYKKFIKLLNNSNKIMLLADNAGEIIFDKLLIETINSYYKNLKIIIAVRDKPVINDVTIKDIKNIKFPQNAQIISNGSQMVGTFLNDCSKIFLSHFNSSDIIISKGQANFESLNNLNRKNIFFLFKSKCEVVSKYLNVPINSFVFFLDF